LNRCVSASMVMEKLLVIPGCVKRSICPFKEKEPSCWVTIEVKMFPLVNPEVAIPSEARDRFPITFLLFIVKFDQTFFGLLKLLKYAIITLSLQTVYTCMLRGLA
jgi:hypothetical protein